MHTEHGVLSARLRTGEDSGGVDAARRVAYVLPAGSCARVVRMCMGSAVCFLDSGAYSSQRTMRCSDSDSYCIQILSQSLVAFT